MKNYNKKWKVNTNCQKYLSSWNEAQLILLILPIQEDSCLKCGFFQFSVNKMLICLTMRCLKLRYFYTGMKKWLRICPLADTTYKPSIINYYVRFGFPMWNSGKESACNAGDVGLIPESGRSPGVRNGNSLQ